MGEEQNGKIHVYTREATELYSASLGNSVHFAYSADGKEYRPLNCNYGMLFAKAEISRENQIVEKGVTAPRIWHDEERGYCITAVRTEADGSVDASCDGKVLLWTTEDFVHFTEYGLVTAESVLAYDEAEVSKALGDALLLQWTPLCHVETEVPEQVAVQTEDDVRKIKAKAIYSDGSFHEKAVCWDISRIDFSVPGAYDVSGEIATPKYGFPLAKGYADPAACNWKGMYYFIATNDNTNAVGLFIRGMKTLSEVFEADAKEYLILEEDHVRGFVQTFWAPEFHVIGGRLYILFAVSGETFGPKSHMMRLKENGNPLRKEDWEEPVKVTDKNGKDLCEEGITLDMTYLKVKERSYLVWSARVNCMSEGDTGSMLYIGEVDEKEPWRLIGDAVLLSRPLYGWENNQGTINNEGPFALQTEDTVYLMYSGGAAGGDSYVIGCLQISCDGDLLCPEAWEKSKAPMLSSFLLEDIYGPGHNSFVTDEEGTVLLMYHAQESAGQVQRCTGIHRVHFTKNGAPVLTMTQKRDVSPLLSKVTMNIRVKRG